MVSVVKQVPRITVECQALETSKLSGTRPWANCFSFEIILLGAECWNKWPPKALYNLNFYASLC